MNPRCVVRLFAIIHLMILSFVMCYLQAQSKDAAQYGFLPGNTATGNTRALNEALLGGGHVVVNQTGLYDVAPTILLESNTTLEFAPGVVLRYIGTHDAADDHYSLFLNRHAATRNTDTNITLRGLTLDINQQTGHKAYRHWTGLLGTIAFYHVQNLHIERLTAYNGESADFIVQICAFEHVNIDGIHLEGKKDGVHVGRGKGLTMRNGRFRTVDDCIALNAYDYTVSQPEVGWIEDVTIEDCTDLADSTNIGYFCRFLAGTWSDWQSGMTFRYSDAVQSDGRIYRLLNNNSMAVTSTQQPTHTSGTHTYADGCTWLMQQEDTLNACAVRGVTFRNIRLGKRRESAFTLMYDNDAYNRGHYPGAPLVSHQDITLSDIHVRNEVEYLVLANCPYDTLRIDGSHFAQSRLCFFRIDDTSTYPTSQLFLTGNTFDYDLSSIIKFYGWDVKLAMDDNRSLDTDKPVAGLKLVTIGDSQTESCGWQPVVAETTGVVWSREETLDGLNGHAPMAVGGTPMMPDSTNSISLRGVDAKYYHPDLIIIYAGQNDPYGLWLTAGNSGTTPKEQVMLEPTYDLAQGVNANASTVSAFKALIEQLQNDLPATRIYLMTHVPVRCEVGMNPKGEFTQWYPSPRFATLDDVIRFEMTERYPKDELIRALGEVYGLTVIDQWKYSGINFLNNVPYYYDCADDCTQVHLKPEGDRLLADVISKYLTGQTDQLTPTEFAEIENIEADAGQQTFYDLMGRSYAVPSSASRHIKDRCFMYDGRLLIAQ